MNATCLKAANIARSFFLIGAHIVIRVDANATQIEMKNGDMITLTLLADLKVIE